jgi:hypothetical protein
VIVLGMLAQLALTLNHVDRPKPLAAALLVFTLAFVTVLATLALHEQPALAPKAEALSPSNAMSFFWSKTRGN